MHVTNIYKGLYKNIKNAFLTIFILLTFLFSAGKIIQITPDSSNIGTVLTIKTTAFNE